MDLDLSIWKYVSFGLECHLQAVDGYANRTSLREKEFKIKTNLVC